MTIERETQVKAVTCGTRAERVERDVSITSLIVRAGAIRVQVAY
jgi:hypothetical protein